MLLFDVLRLARHFCGATFVGVLHRPRSRAQTLDCFAGCFVFLEYSLRKANIRIRLWVAPAKQLALKPPGDLMKTTFLQLSAAALLTLTALSAMAQSTLGYGTIRPRAMTDSVGAPRLTSEYTTSPATQQLQGGSVPSGTHCGWIQMHNDGNMDAMVPCSGQPIPMGNNPTCPAGYFLAGYDLCQSEEGIYTYVGGEAGYEYIYTYITPTLVPGMVYNSRFVTHWNCPSSFYFAGLGGGDGKRYFSCVKG